MVREYEQRTYRTGMDRALSGADEPLPERKSHMGDGHQGINGTAGKLQDGAGKATGCPETKQLGRAI